jgi:negative regulator of flagellin synthesis FlgM
MQIDPTRLHKITTGALDKIAPAQVDAPQAAETQATTAAAGASRLELSQRAAEVQAAHQALAQTPEVRAEQIAALKAQMAAGTYHVNPENIANKMIPD